MENIVLILFSCLALFSALLLYSFFQKVRTRPCNERTWGKLVQGNALVLIFLVSIILLGGELFFRFFYDTPDSYDLSKVSHRWFARHYQINTSRVRDSVSSYKEQIAGGKLRITFIGDSFTAGHGVPNVEERFANLIRSRETNWEVHVFAFNGTETGDHLTILKTILPQDYQFNIVVLIYVLNDISDLAPEYRQKMSIRIQTRWQPWWIIRESYFLNTLYYRFRIARDPDTKNYYHFVQKLYQGPAWEQQKVRLRELRDVVRERGGTLLVVTFPFLHEMGNKTYSFFSAHKQLDRLWQDLGVPHLDLLNTFQAYQGKELVVGRYDAHPNEKAHAMAADAIEKFLKAQITASGDNRHTESGATP